MLCCALSARAVARPVPLNHHGSKPSPTGKAVVLANSLASRKLERQLSVEGATQPSSLFGKMAAGFAMSLALSLSAPAIQGFQALAEPSSADVGPCVVRSCGIALAQCLADPTCVENLACLQSCEGKPDKSGCQVKCGDLYSNESVQRFDTCAITTAKCVPQIPDDGSYPVPPECSLVKKFDTKDFTGRWFITAGLNPLFDTFDCQAHYFTQVRPGNLYGAINWRVKKANGFFYNRNAMQKFVQDPENPAHIKVTGGEFLHFSDDWYILGSKFENGPDDYLLVYYRGNNDAWDGYGGGTLYTRSSTVPEAIVPEVKASLEAAGLDWSKWAITDNTCGPEPKVLEEKILEAEESISNLEKQAVVAVETELEVELLELQVDVEEELKILKRAVESEFEFLKGKQQELLSDVKALTSRDRRAANIASKDKKKAEQKLMDMMSKEGLPGIEMPK